VVYAQMSRGKTEKLVSFGLSSIASTLSRLAMDCCLYMNQNFGFISFPDELTTGSSIMPHKKNPDVFELIRAKCNRIQSIPNELSLLMNNLPSGYHRDMQLTKEILFPALGDLKSCIDMTVLMLSHIRIKKDILQDEKYKWLFSVEAVNELVNRGIPFREAYKTIGDQISTGNFSFDQSLPLKHSHEGSLGNLNLPEIKAEMEDVLSKF
jgi:argininosuccinate lyase